VYTTPDYGITYSSLRTIKCCSVVFGVTLRLLVINSSSSSPAINKLCRLLHHCLFVWCSIFFLLLFLLPFVVNKDVHYSRSVDSTRWSQILAQNRDCCLLHLHPTPAPVRGIPIGILPWRLVRKKLEWYGYSTVKKFEDMFIPFDRILVYSVKTNKHIFNFFVCIIPDRQTDRGVGWHRMTA